MLGPIDSPPTADLATPARALAIGAHPDDIEFGCGATLAKWSDDGCEVHLLVLTDGSKGTWDPHADLDALIALRATEQRAAAAALGARSVAFLGVTDGELTNDRATCARVCEVIRSTRPDVVLSHDPWKQYRLHPDHRNAGFLVTDALVAARDPHFFADQELAHHRPEVLLLFEAERIDHIERVDETIQRKVDALLEHRSQWRSTHGIHDQPEAQLAAFATRVVDAAERAGRAIDIAGTVGLAEGFKRMAL